MFSSTLHRSRTSHPPQSVVLARLLPVHSHPRLLPPLQQIYAEDAAQRATHLSRPETATHTKADRTLCSQSESSRDARFHSG